MSNYRVSALTIVRENPTIVGGVVAFGCMFALIAGNALYSQPGLHPGPMWNTRDNVTTHSVQTSSNVEQLTASNLYVAEPEQRPASRYFNLANLPVTPLPHKRPSDAASIKDNSVVAVSDKKSESVVASENVLSQTQDRLKRLGLYNGKVDGLYGPATKRAIEAYQVNAGLQKDGRPSPALLFSINHTIGLINPQASVKKSSLTNGLLANAMPKEILPKSNDELAQTASNTAVEPVSFQAPSAQPIKPVAEQKQEEIAELAPVKAALVTDEAPNTIPNDMIRLAQKGLTVFGIDGIEASGVLTPKTVEALVRFQERYQLSTTGMPDENTIRKMIDIGALKRG